MMMKLSDLRRRKTGGHLASVLCIFSSALTPDIGTLLRTVSSKICCINLAKSENQWHKLNSYFFLIF
jgi:hypothetical protein